MSITGPIATVFRRQVQAFRKDSGARSWLIVAAITIALLAIVSVVFSQEAVGAYRVWMGSPTFNHCFLILPISLYMMWSRRDRLTAVSIAPEPRAALLVLIVSLAWLSVSALTILEAQQFVVITLLQAVFFSVMGAPVYRRLSAPLLYLYFLVPSGAFLVPILQDITARFAVLGLHLIRIPVFSNGAVIEIPAGTFAVAEACAGLRFLVATIAFGVFFACETYRGISRRLLFIALCIVVPILANGLRVFGLLLAAQWIGDATAALADHIIYGWGFFSIVLLLLVFLGRSFSDIDSTESEARREMASVRINVRRTVLTASLCVIAAISFPVVAMFLDNPPAASLPPIPPLPSPWKAVSDDGRWAPVVVGASRTFHDAYSGGGHTFYRFIALYVPQGRNSNLIRSENRVADENSWKYNSSTTGRLDVNGQEYPVNITVLDSGARRLVVWSFYIFDGQIVSSLWGVKFLQVRDYFTGSACPSAFVAIAVDGVEGDAQDTLAARYFSAMSSFPNSLCKKRTQS